MHQLFEKTLRKKNYINFRAIVSLVSKYSKKKTRAAGKALSKVYESP